MVEKFEFENILAGFQSHVVTREVTVAANQELSLGQAFELDASGYAIEPISSPKDPNLIHGLMADAIATGVTVKKSVYYAAGEFNKNKVILPVGAVFKDYDIALRNKGIYLNDVVKAEGV